MTLLAVLAIVPRVAHFGGVIEDPHSWVQADREFSVWSYYRHGITLLDMHVCFLGGHKSCLYEFPIPDVLPAIAYRVFGPDVIFARFVTLLFFFGAAYYLYKFVAHLFDERLALASVAVYLVLPLGIYYSRAILMHDFAAIFFAHGMVYYYLRGADEDSTALRITGAAFAALALLIKPPYVFYFFLPLAFYFAQRESLRRLLRLTPIYIAPALPFLVWRAWVNVVNSRQPDWYFIPGYRKRDDLSFWFYGPLDMRFDGGNWAVLSDRIVWEILTPIGCALFALGVILLRREVNYSFFLLWAFGAFIAILVFFNVNVVHNYYQNSLLALAAVGIAAGLRALAPVTKSGWRAVPAVAAILVFAAICIHAAETQFFRIDVPAIAAARVISDTTPEDALVVTVSPSYHKPTDTRILGRAHRAGWAIPTRDVSVEILERLRGEGAVAVAVMNAKGAAPVPSDVESYLSPYLVTAVSVPNAELTVVVYRFGAG